MKYREIHHRTFEVPRAEPLFAALIRVRIAVNPTPICVSRSPDFFCEKALANLEKSHARKYTSNVKSLFSNQTVTLITIAAEISVVRCVIISRCSISRCGKMSEDARCNYAITFIAVTFSLKLLNFLQSHTMPLFPIGPRA